MLEVAAASRTPVRPIVQRQFGVAMGTDPQITQKNQLQQLVKHKQITAAHSNHRDAERSAEIAKHLTDQLIEFVFVNHLKSSLRSLLILLPQPIS
jgi:tRNA isopentenyl-2-thiomethyl-A-37 hydroxylase MiaE